MRKTNNFRDGLLGLGQGAKSGRIGVGVHLFYELERNKIEDKGLLVEHHNHHVLAQLDVHNELIGVKGNLCPIFLLVVVPNDNFVPLLLVDQHYHIRFVHHFHQGDLLVQILHLFL